MTITKQKKPVALSEDEVAYFLSAIGIAPLVMRSAHGSITKKYDLGPRGAWIMGLIKVDIVSPSDLSEALMIGRSLFTSELTRLVRAGLVSSRRNDADGRRLTLSLTPEGEQVIVQIRGELTRFVNERLAGYEHDEILMCTRILREFGGVDEQFFNPGT